MRTSVYTNGKEVIVTANTAMRREDIEAAMAEARRFLREAGDVLAKVPQTAETIIGASRTDRGAFKRASLDLTRRLAIMRNRSRGR